MKIPIEIQRFARADRPVLLFTVRIPQLRVNRPVKALIDTGSPRSVISDSDAKLMQIPKSQLEFVESTYIAGNKVNLCSLNKKITLKMFDDKKKLIDIDYPLLIMDNQGKEKTKNISIIGLDFLEKNRFALYCDPANKKGYLEKV